MASERLTALLIELGASSEERSSASDAVILSSRARRTTFLTNTLAAAACVLRDKKVRIQDYVNVVLPRYSVDDFRSRFRLSRESFEKLVAHMTPLMLTHCPRQKISTEKKFLVYLKYIATQLHFQAIAHMFGICETTVHGIVHEVSRLISSELLNELVEWPSGIEVQCIEKGFRKMQGFPGVIGAIDGSHIPVKTPLDCPENYINRKGFPSVIVQAVCDHNMKFIDIYCGWPGSVHDARVLRNSPLCRKAEINLEAVFPNDTHLLGDAAYPISSWLLVPFKDGGNLTAAQKLYNYKHKNGN